MKTEYIDVTPHKSIMLKLGQSGYSITEALAELVDNSLDAKIPDAKLTVKIDIFEDQIIIEDDALGMNKDEAADSIRLGFSKKKNQLGKFGLGLKTACASLGKQFLIKTGKKDSNEEYSLVYDEDSWMQDGDWNKFPLMIAEKEPLKQGTFIKISNLIVKKNEKTISKIVEEFSKRFSPFISNEELDLIINEHNCNPYNFDITKEGKTEFELSLKFGNKIKGWFGYKLKDEVGEYFGFNTFRRNRLISSYDKFMVSKRQKSKQIVGEVHLDHVPVTHNKRDWVREAEEFKEVKFALIKYLRQFDQKHNQIIRGISAHPGLVEGTARVIMLGALTPIEELEKIREGDILITEMTRPQFLLQIQRAGAIVTNLGGSLCHAAILSREFGIPCVVGTQNATEYIRDGQRIIVDAQKGVIYDAEK